MSDTNSVVAATEAWREEPEGHSTLGLFTALWIRTD